MLKVEKEINDFASTHKELLKYWNYEKNTIQPNEITYGSHQKVWWICEKCHNSYESSIKQFVYGTRCPYCAGQKVLKGYNDFETWCKNNNFQNLLKEWDFNLNEKKPNEIAVKSNIPINWICSKCNWKWKTPLINRTKANPTGCPSCANRVLNVGFNDLETRYPEIAKEWNYEKNYPLKPSEIICGTSKKYWWKCKNNHEWQAAVSSRVKGHFCKECDKRKRISIAEKIIVFYLKMASIAIEENKKIGKRELDIFIPSKNIAIEYDGQRWHKNRDKDIEKNKLCQNLGIILYRIREPLIGTLNDTSIDLVINNLTSDFSYMNKIIKLLFEKLNINFYDIDVNRDYLKIYQYFEQYQKFSSIVETNPDLICEWHPTKNGKLRPENFSKGDHTKIWWICSKCGYEWQTKIYVRCNGYGCPMCNRKRNSIKLSTPHIGIDDLATINPKLAKEWNYKKNGDLTPQKVYGNSNRKVWWLCKNGHEWQATIDNRNKGKNCPYCSNKKILIGYNDLATINTKLAKEWNFKKNGNLTPQKVTANSNKKVWWICKNGHEWQACIADRNNGTNCPYCSNKKVLIGYNDLATINPELAKEWNYKKNGDLTPQKVTANSNKKVWWICKNGHEWEAIISNRNRRNSKCSKCKNIY